MKNIIILISLFLSTFIYGQRSTGIELEIEFDLIPKEVLDSNELDIEFSSKEGYYILWIHESGYKPLEKKHFENLNAAKSAYNRKTKTNHLNLFIETDDTIGVYGMITEDNKKYKNIKFSELGVINITKVKFKRELKEKK
jgi:hypothetical protein